MNSDFDPSKPSYTQKEGQDWLKSLRHPLTEDLVDETPYPPEAYPYAWVCEYTYPNGDKGYVFAYKRDSCEHLFLDKVSSLNLLREIPFSGDDYHPHFIPLYKGP